MQEETKNKVYSKYIFCFVNSNPPAINFADACAPPAICG